MNKNGKIFILGGATILTGLGAYYFIKKRKAAIALKNETENSQGSNGAAISNTNNTVSVNTPIVNGFPLRYGMKNDLNVLALQKALQKKLTPTKWPNSQITGNYMEKTAAAVKSFIGRDTVSEADFRQFVGTPVGGSPSVSNPIASVFSAQNLSNWIKVLNPFANK